MPTVRFTANIQRHVACPTLEVGGATVRAVLEAYFAQVPAARGYVLDDQARLRKHMVAFVNGQQVADRDGLADVIAADAELDIVQALSGGQE
ncbi:MAG: MoaD/ThiS family protein [Vicinamibacterales bacterium]